MVLRLASRRALLVVLLAQGAIVAACGSDGGETGGGGHTTSASSTTGPSTGGVPNTGSTTATTSTGTGGTGTGTTTTGTGTGGAPVSSLDALLAELRADAEGALLSHAADTGWPVPVVGGYLFVCTDPTLTKLVGDHDGWAGAALTPDTGFSWIVVSVADGDHYKFTDGTRYVADPWARAYDYDQYGEISLVRPSAKHLDRYLAVGDATMPPRTVRVLVPAQPVTHVLYAHDGQNLFDPDGPWGGWHLQDTAPDGMLIVGIDNTPGRMDEYTHVSDIIDSSGSFVGGLGDQYADFLENTVRPLVKLHYGEPGPVGVMGSSLGGLISLHIAHRNPGGYAFAASLSGTMGWGSIGAAVHHETMIERYAAGGKQAPVLYVDSGGSGTTCADGDGDGIDDDDPNASDNYCENIQMADVLRQVGYKDNIDLVHWHEQGAEHNEAAWAARVFRPLSVFASL